MKRCRSCPADRPPGSRPSYRAASVAVQVRMVPAISASMAVVAIDGDGGLHHDHGRAIRALLSTSALQCPTPVAILPAQSGRVGRPCLGNARSNAQWIDTKSHCDSISRRSSHFSAPPPAISPGRVARIVGRRRTSAPCFLRSCRSRQARPSCRRYRRPAIAVPAEPGPLHAWRGQAVAIFSPARSSARTRLRRRFPRHIPAR